MAVVFFATVTAVASTLAVVSFVDGTAIFALFR